MMASGFENKEQIDEITKAFQAFDSNGDGYITREELRDAMQSIGDILSDEELEAMMRKADLNNDGRVDFAGKILQLYTIANMSR